MERINLNNYEAFLLDYLEGNLDGATRSEMEVFLLAHPELAEDLEGLSELNLQPERAVFDASSLKAPVEEKLKSDPDLRDELYFKSIEGELSPQEGDVLSQLVRDEKYKNELRLWEMTKLSSDSQKMDRSRLYRLPLSLPIDRENVEYFLIARSEGLLSEVENTELEHFCEANQGFEKELILAESLRLKAPQGVFFPDKESLKKKERRGLILFYRAAVVILILGLIGSLSLLLREDKPQTPQLARSQAEATDSLKMNVEEKPAASPDSSESLQNKKDILLDDWEQMEPDPVELANEEEILPNTSPQPTDREKVRDLKPMEVMLADLDISPPRKDLLNTDRETELQRTAPQTSEPEYLTIGELAEQRLARELELSEEERDQVALSIARRITERVGEALDTEIKKETNPDTEQLTYSLRIGKLKISRTRAK